MGRDESTATSSARRPSPVRGLEAVESGVLYEQVGLYHDYRVRYYHKPTAAPAAQVT